MKPLLHTKVTRARKRIGDWVSAADQATDDGRLEFAQRQEERRRAAQGKPQPEPSNVELITQRRKR
jgi:hypothetical protein